MFVWVRDYGPIENTREATGSRSRAVHDQTPWLIASSIVHNNRIDHCTYSIVHNNAFDDSTGRDAEGPGAVAKPTHKGLCSDTDGC